MGSLERTITLLHWKLVGDRLVCTNYPFHSLLEVAHVRTNPNGFEVWSLQENEKVMGMGTVAGMMQLAQDRVDDLNGALEFFNQEESE